LLARTKSLAGQFVFDVQTHFVRDDFKHQELLDLAGFASEHWNPQMKQEGVSSLAPLQVPELHEGDLLRQRHLHGAF